MFKGGFPLPIRITRSSRSPKFPDQTRPSSTKRVYMTSSRPLVDNTRIPHDSFTTSTQPSFRFPLHHLDLYASPIRSQLDQVDLSSITTRSSHDQIVMVVLKSYKVAFLLCFASLEVYSNSKKVMRDKHDVLHVSFVLVI
ncbi:hypothetical protein DPMN_010633 [Dreissena polymorpha]|uniref:Uncharacterized protein n=1 Tax=Dreissena polymorpha TaxID=45954 RepID=A0A9D4S1P6_DREPO|nr:hypothetical protein DPMN_010633 [Dreissena polymorpha]